MTVFLLFACHPEPFALACHPEPFALPCHPERSEGSVSLLTARLPLRTGSARDLCPFRLRSFRRGQTPRRTPCVSGDSSSVRSRNDSERGFLGRTPQESYIPPECPSPSPSRDP